MKKKSWTLKKQSEGPGAATPGIVKKGSPWVKTYSTRPEKKIEIKGESLKIIKTIEISEKKQYPNSCYHPHSILKVDF